MPGAGAVAEHLREIHKHKAESPKHSLPKQQVSKYLLVDTDPDVLPKDDHSRDWCSNSHMEAGEEGVVTASDRVGVSHKGHTLLESTAPVLC